MMTAKKKPLFSRFALLLAMASVLLLLLSGCGSKPTEPAPYAGGKNPAEVPPAAGPAAAAQPAGGPPEAAAYQQKMAPNGKAPGAR